MKPVISLVISTYNRPSALNIVLQSVLLQEKYCDEIIIADDGSGDDTKSVINEFSSKFKNPVKHVWHEDNGYRLGEIRNKAIIESNGDYIVQIDGDCILHPMFIKDHVRFAKAGTFVFGTRTLLDRDFTDNLLDKKILSFPLNAGRHLSKKINSFHNNLLSRLLYIVQRGRKNYLYVKGCNMAFWKKDFLKVNGYNEDILGWGKEDNELALRLLNMGLSIRAVKCSAIQYHLFHEEINRCDLTRNEEILKQTEKLGLKYALNGICKGN